MHGQHSCPDCHGLGAILVTSEGQPYQSGTWLINQNATWQRCHCSMALEPLSVFHGIDAKGKGDAD
jgi:hypothetical protein